jgi:hypothetical protein
MVAGAVRRQPWLRRFICSEPVSIGALARPKVSGHPLRMTFFNRHSNTKCWERMAVGI